MSFTNRMGVGESTFNDLSLEVVLQDHFNVFEQRINKRVASGLKQGLRLIVEKLDKDMSNKMKEIEKEISSKMKEMDELLNTKVKDLTGQ